MTFVLLLIVAAEGGVVSWFLMRLIRVIEGGQRDVARQRHPSYAPQTERPVDLGPSVAQQHLAFYDAQRAAAPAQPYGPTGPFQRPEV